MKSFMGAYPFFFVEYMRLKFFVVELILTCFFFGLGLLKWRMRRCVVRSVLLQRLEAMRCLNICMLILFVLVPLN